MASNASSLENLVSLYKHVIDDVVKNMKEEYLNEGVDPELLEELRQIWLGKLNLSGVISRPAKSDAPSHSSKITPTDSAKSHKHTTLVSKTNVPGPPPLVSVSSSPSSVASSRPAPSPPSLIPTPTPPRSLQQATPTTESTSSVIQIAPPRTTPTSVSQAAPQLLIHPGMLAAAQQASNNVSVANVAQGVLEQLQQASAASGGGVTGGGASIPTAGSTPSIMPFPLNLVNSTVGQQLATFQQGMVPVQTQQGTTVLIPLQTFMALNQVKQNQAAAAAVAAATAASSSKSSDQQQSSASSKEKEVVQLDGLLPLVSRGDSNLHPNSTATTTMMMMMSQDMMSSTVMSSQDVMMSSEMMSHSILPGAGGGESSVAAPRTDSMSTNDACHYTHYVHTVKQWNGNPGQSHSSSKYKSHSNTVSKKKLNRSSAKVIVQLDGPTGESSSSDDDSDLDDSSEDEVGDANAGDDDPLNSEDDVSDGEGSKDGGDFDTQDTIVCQWEKVYRVKNKWKFQLKDGIMHLGGFDYVCQKINGEADW